MTQEQLRMQMLAGIITEGQYKAKLNENQTTTLLNDEVILYTSDDSKLAPKFIQPKRIGYIIYNPAIKDQSKSILSITGTLSKNPQVNQIFTDNYGSIDPNYITLFFTTPNNWKAITDESELNNFISKYNKIYLINHNGESTQIKGSSDNTTSIDRFVDTEEGGFIGIYIENIAKKEDLDLNYRSDFDYTFNKALKLLKKDQPQLDFNLIIQNKEQLW
jgi:hypothetical protein